LFSMEVTFQLFKMLKFILIFFRVDLQMLQQDFCSLLAIALLVWLAWQMGVKTNTFEKC
jgi:hypothetical protein